MHRNSPISGDLANVDVSFADIAIFHYKVSNVVIDVYIAIHAKVFFHVNSSVELKGNSGRHVGCREAFTKCFETDGYYIASRSKRIGIKMHIIQWCWHQHMKGATS